MNWRYIITPEFGAGIPVHFSTTVDPGDTARYGVRSMPGYVHGMSAPIVVNMAMGMARTKWFSFLRRVFQYQNGSRSDVGANPCNSPYWIAIEFMVLTIQITLITVTLSVTKEEKPMWPLRIWIMGYAVGCFSTLPLLYWRYHHPAVTQGNASRLSNVSPERSNEESRSSMLMNKSRTIFELYFAIWFVMGNIWVFDSRYGSFDQAPKLHILCLSILAWNAITYSFPFILFILLCCCVPCISYVFGYNMNMASFEKGASDDQLAKLLSWRYEDVDSNHECGDTDVENGIPECCICLAKYKEKEEVRQLPCFHTFHLKCVDKWLRILSCCPLCKKEIEK